MFDKPRCFVIMPISKTSWWHSEKYWRIFFERFLKPSLEDCGYEAYRSEATPESIPDAIIRDLLTADLVLAVLTDMNPNVWYELGVRHASRQGTVMVMDHKRSKRLPFDVRHHGVILYNPKDREAFKGNLKRYIKLLEDNCHDNPVSKAVEMGMPYVINEARTTLRKTVEFLEASQHEAQEAEQIISKMMANWGKKRQVTLLDGEDKVFCHQDNNNLNVEGSSLWHDPARNKASLFPYMKSSNRGMLIYQGLGRPGRITAMAYRTLERNNWMVVAESHFYHQGTSPY